MNFLRKKTFWIMLFIAILGLILRLIFLDKPDGLWNDEYISWSIASTPFHENFWDKVFAQCHMPFYYLYLKFFIHFFGNSDILLRLTSVFAGMLSIVGMFFVGKELKNEKLGILCASVAAMSSFLIYYSQEVRMYQILFFFSAMSLLFTLKLIKNPKLSNCILYVISNFLILFTHTIGFVFVLFNLLFVSYSLVKLDKIVNKGYKKIVKVVWISLFALSIICLPLVFKIFSTSSFSQWWGHFTFAKIGFLITDYFSPILINLTTAPDNFFFNFHFNFVKIELLPALIVSFLIILVSNPNIFLVDPNLSFIIFELFPSLFAIFGIVKALKTKSPEILGLFYVSVATIVTLAIAAIFGKLVFITKYSIEIYPILLVIMGYGLLKIENRIVRHFLIFAFCFLNLFYIIQNPNSAPKLRRAEGHKLAATILENANLKPNDYIVLNYYTPDKFEKYFDFKKYNVIDINKANFVDYISDSTYLEVLKNGKTLYKPIFLSDNNKHFSDKLNTELFSKLKSNQKVTILVLNTVALHSPTQLKTIAADEKQYDKTPLMFLAFSYVKNQLLQECLNKLQIVRVEDKGRWVAITFTKI